jgi:clorobiocin biosynthesis protein CloN7
MMARKRSAADHFFAHLLRPTALYLPQVQALRNSSTEIVVTTGTTSKGQLAHRTAVALARQLGTGTVDFPGSHVGFVEQPILCARLLRQLLNKHDAVSAGPA